MISLHDSVFELMQVRVVRGTTTIVHSDAHEIFTDKNV